jgi:DNA polymerase-4
LQAHGIANDEVYTATERKSISRENTFAEDVTDASVLRDTLRWAAQEVGFSSILIQDRPWTFLRS